MNKLYFAIDGNNTGKRIESYILSNDMDGLREFTQIVSRTVLEIEQRIKSQGGTIYMAGGDNLLAEIRQQDIGLLDELPCSIKEGRYHFSAALADTPQGAYIGLKYAKSVGASKVCVIWAEDGHFLFKTTEKFYEHLSR